MCKWYNLLHLHSFGKMFFFLSSAIWRVQGTSRWVPAQRGHPSTNRETEEKTWWTSPPQPPWSPRAQSQPKSTSHPSSSGTGDRESWQTGARGGQYILIQETPLLFQVQRSGCLQRSCSSSLGIQRSDKEVTVMFSQIVWLGYRSSSFQNWEKIGSFWCSLVLQWH